MEDEVGAFVMTVLSDQAAPMADSCYACLVNAGHFLPVTATNEQLTLALRDLLQI